MAKATTKTTTARTADAEPTKTVAARIESALVQPDPDAKPVEPVSLTQSKDSTKAQFEAADAAAARATSGL